MLLLAGALVRIGVAKGHGVVQCRDHRRVRCEERTVRWKPRDIGVTGHAIGEPEAIYAERTLHSNLADRAVEYGIATRSELEDIAAAWRTWGRDPDALFCFSHTQVVAWKR